MKRSNETGPGHIGCSDTVKRTAELHAAGKEYLKVKLAATGLTDYCQSPHLDLTWREFGQRDLTDFEQLIANFPPQSACKSNLRKLVRQAQGDVYDATRKLQERCLRVTGQIKKGIVQTSGPPCSNQCGDTAVVKCAECKERLCDSCNRVLHLRKKQHTVTRITKKKAMTRKARYQANPERSEWKRLTGLARGAQDIKLALTMFFDKVGAGLQADSSLVSMVLSNCASQEEPLDWLAKAEAVFQTCKDKGVVLKDNPYTVMIQLCCRWMEAWRPNAERGSREGETSSEIEGRLDKAMTLLTEMGTLDIKLLLRTYAPLLLCCATLGTPTALQTAFGVWNKIQQAGLEASDREFRLLFRLCAANSLSAPRTDAILRQLSLVVFRPEPSTLDSIQSCIVNAGGTVSEAKVDSDGRCSVCDAILQSVGLAEAEHSHMLQQVVGMVNKQRGKQEFPRLQSFLTRHSSAEAPIDVLIDGANIGFFKRRPDKGGSLSFQQIDRVAQYWASKGKRTVIFLHARHLDTPDSPGAEVLKTWAHVDASGAISPAETATSEGAQDAFAAPVLYTTPKRCNDDWYWLYAGVWISKTNPHLFIVTHDQMRDHHFQSLHARPFNAWRARHRVGYCLQPSHLPPTFTLPWSFSTRVQSQESGKGGPSWHIPQESTHDTRVRLGQWDTLRLTVAATAVSAASQIAQATANPPLTTATDNEKDDEAPAVKKRKTQAPTQATETPQAEAPKRQGKKDMRRRPETKEDRLVKEAKAREAAEMQESAEETPGDVRWLCCALPAWPDNVEEAGGGTTLTDTEEGAEEATATATVVCLPHRRSGTCTYVVSDPQSKSCLLIDTVADYDSASGRMSFAHADMVLAHVNACGLVVERILETRLHGNHFSAANYLKLKLGGSVPVCVGMAAKQLQDSFGVTYALGQGPACGTGCYDVLFQDNATFQLGGVPCQVLATPGHSLACVSYVIGDAVFTGHALLLPDIGTGRCDLPGLGGDANILWASTRRLFQLPPLTKVFVGHDTPTTDRGFRFKSTIREQTASNKMVGGQESQASFVTLRTRRDEDWQAQKDKRRALQHAAVQCNLRAGMLPVSDHSQKLTFWKLPVRWWTEDKSSKLPLV